MTARTLTIAIAAGVLLLSSYGVALAEDGVSQEMFTANNIWMMLAAGLVFTMHLGFATLESGLTRAKNTTNILFKNTFIVCVGIITYALVGFNLMYPGDFVWTPSPCSNPFPYASASTVVLIRQACPVACGICHGISSI